MSHQCDLCDDPAVIYTKRRIRKGRGKKVTIEVDKLCVKHDTEVYPAERGGMEDTK